MKLKKTQISKNTHILFPIASMMVMTFYRVSRNNSLHNLIVITVLQPRLSLYEGINWSVLVSSETAERILRAGSLTSVYARQYGVIKWCNVGIVSHLSIRLTGVYTVPFAGNVAMITTLGSALRKMSVVKIATWATSCMAHS